MTSSHFYKFEIMNNENFPHQLSNVAVTVNWNLNSLGLIKFAIAQQNLKQQHKI